MVGVSSLALYLIVFIAFFDTFALLPVLAPYTKQLGAPGWLVGWVIGIYSLTNLLANFGSGYLLDSFGRKRPMVFSLLLAAVLIALYGIVPSAWALFVVRALHGLTGAVFIPAMFVLVCESRSQDRARAMGRAGAMIGLVALVAPPIGGALYASLGAPALFFTIAGLMGLGGWIAAVRLQETFTQRPESLRPNPKQVLRHSALQTTYLATFGFTFCMGVLIYRLPLMVTAAGYNESLAGRLMGLFALVAILVMAFMRGFTPYKRAAFGLGVMGFSLLALEQAPVPNGIAVVMLTYGAGFGLAFPALHLLAFERAPEGLRGTAFAVLYAFYSLGIVMGSVSAGLLEPVIMPGRLGGFIALFMVALSLWRGFALQTKAEVAKEGYPGFTDPHAREACASENAPSHSGDR